MPQELSGLYMAGISIEDIILENAINKRTNNAFLNEDDGEPHCNCNWHYNFSEIYFKIRPQLCPSHENTTLSSRINAAAFQIANPAVFKAVLEPEWTSDLDGLLLNFVAECGFSIIHSIIEHGGLFYCFVRTRNSLDPIPYWQEWFELATEVISRIPTPAKLKQLDIHLVLYEFTREGISAINAWNRITHTLLREWILALKKAGVDLVKYGRLQNKIIRQYPLDDKSSARCFFPTVFPSRAEKQNIQCRRLPVYLIAYKLGPEPSDWDIYWSEPTDVFAGDFWNLIEDPPLQIPGAWENAFDE